MLATTSDTKEFTAKERVDRSKRVYVAGLSVGRNTMPEASQVPLKLGVAGCASGASLPFILHKFTINFLTLKIFNNFSNNYS